ncbi:MAG: hypothetical protein AAF602_14930, partial [Myxococcota bacterium]
RALLGLSACPCPESTDALIRLYREAAEPSVRAQITRVLLDRVPAEALWGQWRRFDPANVGRMVWFSRRTFVDRHHVAIRHLARQALAEPTTDASWGAQYAFGAQVLSRLGQPDDGGWLVEATARALHPESAPAVTNARHGVLQHFLAALASFPEAAGIDVGTEAMVALAQVPLGGSLPPDAEERLNQALQSGHPDIVALALRRIRPPLGPELRAGVAAALDTDEPWVLARGLGVIARAPHPAYRVRLLELLRTSPGERIGSVVTTAVQSGVSWDEALSIVLTRLERESDPDAQLMDALLSCLQLKPGSSMSRRPLPASETPGVVRAWRAFVAGQRARLRDGPPFEAGDPALPAALIPGTYRYTLPDGTHWPVR